MHTKERTFQCPSCPRAFATSWQAKSHFKTNHGQKKSYKCQKCNKAIFNTPQALAGHVKSFHGTKVRIVIKLRRAQFSEMGIILESNFNLKFRPKIWIFLIFKMLLCPQISTYKAEIWHVRF